MTVALTLDLMELSDVGARPDRLADEILRQIRAQFGALPIPVPLEAIASAAGITSIEERVTDSFDGALVALPDRSAGVIVLRKGLASGRRRFTLGHELGHFVNPYHRPPSGEFYCGAGALSARRDSGGPWKDRSPFERMEVEANEFSSFVLVPRRELRLEMQAGGERSLQEFISIAERYAVSLEALAQIYVGESKELIGILTSRNGMVARCILPAGFPYLGLRKGQPLPARSVTAAFVRGAEPRSLSEPLPVQPDVWLDRSAHGTAVYEQALSQRDGWALTLLAVELPESDEGESDSADWLPPRFGKS